MTSLQSIDDADVDDDDDGVDDDDADDDDAHSQRSQWQWRAVCSCSGRKDLSGNAEL